MAATPYKKRTPIWITLIIILSMMPVLIFPLMISSVPTDNPGRLLTYFYPVYVLGAGLCAWLTYPQRPQLSWILIILMLLSHAAMYILVEGL